MVLENRLFLRLLQFLWVLTRKAGRKIFILLLGHHIQEVSALVYPLQMAPIPVHRRRENPLRPIPPNLHPQPGCQCHASIHLLPIGDKMTFMRTNSEEWTRMGKWIVRSIPVAAIAFSVWVTLTLISEGRYYPATGWGIMSIVFTFWLILMFIKPRENKTSDISHHKSQGRPIIHEGDEFVLLYSSKDIVRITQIEQALRTRGIDCTVLDRHGSVMMSFIPDIEMRIIVPREDYEWSVQIMNELMDKSISSWYRQLSRQL